MLKILCLCLFFVGCTTTGKTPQTVGGVNPYDTPVPNGKMVLVDMGYVVGTIDDKKIHAYYVAYDNGIGTTMDHLYVLEGSNQVGVVQLEGETTKHISVIIDKDTFQLKR